MKKPKAIIFSGYGLNCEEETKLAFERAGGEADIVHVNDLVDGLVSLRRYQILAVPGGFSYGDDTGSGKAYAHKIKNHLAEEIEKFFAADKLGMGICNGFQILTNAGLLPGALTYNDSARYTVRWVDLEVAGESPWLKGIRRITLPIAHGEGKFVGSKELLDGLEKGKAIAFRYVKGDICAWQELPANPNGSLRDIAGVLARGGRILGLMPHPERAQVFTQLPHWTTLREGCVREGKPLPKEGPGLQIFKNAVAYFK
ncbi:MAG: phosphoribosylformylglycinamidine synthase subunit PurQ [Candidatus Liptonbacteria bacterium]|nr:phosphoribosylformylglycinamidine synthase subunit PurQ [Candidatus Liptonbacteria bacterium]